MLFLCLLIIISSPYALPFPISFSLSHDIYMYYPSYYYYHSSNKSVKYLSLCTCMENQIYISENYTASKRERHSEEKKMKNCVICLMESFTPLSLLHERDKHYSSISVCISNSASSSFIFSFPFYLDALLTILQFSSLFFSSFNGNWKWERKIFRRKGNVFYEISNAMNEWEKKEENVAKFIGVAKASKLKF